MQICPQFWRFCKFFSKKSSTLCPGVLEEGFDVSFCDGLSEALHEDGEVLEWDVLSTAMVESFVDLLGGDDSVCFHNDLMFIGRWSRDDPLELRLNTTRDHVTHMNFRLVLRVPHKLKFVGGPRTIAQIIF